MVPLKGCNCILEQNLKNQKKKIVLVACLFSQKSSALAWQSSEGNFSPLGFPPLSVVLPPPKPSLPYLMPSQTPCFTHRLPPSSQCLSLSWDDRFTRDDMLRQYAFELTSPGTSPRDTAEPCGDFEGTSWGKCEPWGREKEWSKILPSSHRARKTPSLSLLSFSSF